MLHLQDLAKQGTHSTALTLTERLPNFLSAPCHLNVTYQVESEDDFYLLHLEVNGPLVVTCQRCMQEFNHPYNNQTTIAIAHSDERAEKLLEQYECIVSTNGQINLDDVLIDELYLYAPEFHPDINDCDSVVNQILSEKIET